jgi:hypothetical protein
MTKLQQYIDYVVGMGIASSHEPKKNGTTIQKKYIPWFAIDAVKLHCVTTLQKFGEDKT